MENLNLPDEQQDADLFAKEAEKGARATVAEVYDYLMNTRKWWLAPIIVALLLLGFLVILSSTAAAPFIYTLF